MFKEYHEKYSFYPGHAYEIITSGTLWRENTVAYRPWDNAEYATAF